MFQPSVVHRNWLFIFTQAFNDLEELLEQNDICIAIKERLTKDSGVAAESSYDNIVKKLATKLNAKGLFVYSFFVCY